MGGSWGALQQIALLGLLLCAGGSGYFAYRCKMHHKNEEIPKSCIAHKLQRKTIITYQVFGGAGFLVSYLIFKRDGVDIDKIPGLFFMAVGTFSLMGVIKTIKETTKGGNIHEKLLTVVEAGTDIDRFGGVVYSTYIIQGGRSGKLDEVPSSKPPQLRAPADERAEVKKLLIRGEIKTGEPMWVRLGERWVRTKPVEDLSLREISEIEAGRIGDWDRPS
jgi:hypothetical protein